MGDPVADAGRLKRHALELGFDDAAIAAADPLAAVAHYDAWIGAGRHAGMAWLASDKHRARRADPTRLLPGLTAVLCVVLTHPPARDDARDARLGRVARYAAGTDYHRVMRDLAGRLEHWIRTTLWPGSHALWYADTGAILERGWAERAGIGWIGKHSGLLAADRGSWFLLGEVLLDRPVAHDAPLAREHCGTCVRCIEACPTRAIVAPYQLDARRCISYLTIEHRGPIPRELRAGIGDWVFGCDLCQEACPWNRFAPAARDARLHARTLDGWSLERFLALDAAGFDALFAGSAIRRAGRDGFVRNVCVALGNRGGVAAAAALARTLAGDVSPLVRGHAAWALGELGGHGAEVRPALTAALREPDPAVREEAAFALARLPA